MVTEEELEKIEKYLLGELSKEEEQQIQEQIAKDANFAEAIDIQKDMLLYLGDEQALALNMKLEELGANYVKKNKDSKVLKIKKIWYLGLAASLLIFVIGWSYFASTTDTEQLFASHYKIYVPSELERSSEDTNISLVAKGIEHYSNKNYALAIEELSLALKQENSPKNSHETILFYLSMTYLETKDYELAKKYLEQIRVGKAGVYTQQMYWYLALIELKNGQLETSKQRLKQLIEFSDKGKYAIQAKELLKKL